MARYKDSVCRLCRREGAKLFLKGTKCYTDKCCLSKRNYKYSAIGYNCINFVPRSVKTVNYINQLLGVYANNL